MTDAAQTSEHLLAHCLGAALRTATLQVSLAVPMLKCNELCGYSVCFPPRRSLVDHRGGS
jgi:hypothetical protein